MIANVIDDINHAGGSEEFRAILRILVQEKPPQIVPGKQEAHSSTASPRTQARPKLQIWIERGLLLAGLTLVAIYGAMRFESYIISRAALNRFAAVDVASAAVTDYVEENSSPSELDFSDWDEHRVHAYRESPGKEFGVPLAVLQIPKSALKYHFSMEQTL